MTEFFFSHNGELIGPTEFKQADLVGLVPCVTGSLQSKLLSPSPWCLLLAVAVVWCLKWFIGSREKHVWFTSWLCQEPIPAHTLARSPYLRAHQALSQPETLISGLDKVTCMFCLLHYIISKLVCIGAR
jgi:hypothetical protein